MKIRPLIASAILVSSSLFSFNAFADYGKDAAQAYMGDFVAQVAKEEKADTRGYYTLRVQVIQDDMAKVFNKFYQAGMAYEGQELNQNKVRQYVLSTAQQLEITDNTYFRRFMKLGVQAMNDGANNAPFHGIEE